MSKKKQCELVLEYIRDYGSITQLEALRDLGVMRLASRVSDINKAEPIIKCELVQDKNRYGEPVRYARYSLEA